MHFLNVKSYCVTFAKFRFDSISPRLGMSVHYMGQRLGQDKCFVHTVHFTILIIYSMPFIHNYSDNGWMHRNVDFLFMKTVIL